MFSAIKFKKVSTHKKLRRTRASFIATKNQFRLKFLQLSKNILCIAVNTTTEEKPAACNSSVEMATVSWSSASEGSCSILRAPYIYFASFPPVQLKLLFVQNYFDLGKHWKRTLLHSRLPSGFFFPPSNSLGCVKSRRHPSRPQISSPR